MSPIIFSDILHFAVLLAAVLYVAWVVLSAAIGKYIKVQKAKQQKLDKEETEQLKEILAKDPKGAVFKTLEEWQAEWEKEGKTGPQKWVDLTMLRNYQPSPEIEAELARKQERDKERSESSVRGIENCNPQVIVDIQHGTHYGDISGIFGNVGYNNVQIGKQFSDRPKEEKLINPTVELPGPDKSE